MRLISISLWDFSVAHYGKPQVADTCLQLQDHYGVNVNVLLWSLWLESQNKLLTDDKLALALETIALWDRDYVQPLRQLRRSMKRNFAADLEQVAQVREQIKCAELAAEKQEQQWLEKLALGWPEAEEEIAKGKNLSLYLQLMNLPQEVIARANLQCGN